jgi:hypothetical protein
MIGGQAHRIRADRLAAAAIEPERDPTRGVTACVADAFLRRGRGLAASARVRGFGVAYSWASACATGSSYTESSVSDTRTVSPMPSASKLAMPIAGL